MMIEKSSIETMNWHIYKNTLRYLTNKIDPSVFGWDDIFIVESNGMSYQELNESGIKNSSRDMVISAFIKQRIHYKELFNIKFDKIFNDE